ncbi:DUF1835 domain-containing protein [Clostridium botulinum]|nr:DUF1835 domain-containing protein [Clostridium botulinum]NFH89654.1 DUF1835 domain-containing protein [Clostridium botulinum]NFI16857.1 DUF1835 domain-containing protein [Clostridium botulinum]NFI54381.1 DUF1835 domain-containing protein [Clostridium botulinum]NFL91571.1 DUF1835 domain-containing protein [Clostridium botulinum]
MIEILFGESEAAAMKIAIEKGVILGSIDKVVCLALMLDIGDIREKIDSPYRQQLIFDMYTQNGYYKNEESLKELQKVGIKYIDEQNRFMKYLLKGEPIRIWYSNAPYSMCGLYYICSTLKNISNEIFAVKLPQYIQIQEIFIEYQGWGEIVPEKFNTFIRYEKKLSQLEIGILNNNWLGLIEDNSFLRAVVNGQLIGVPVDFYDHLIYKHLGFKSIKEARLIGDILGNYPLGIGDWWYALRIEHMIENNKIRIVEDSDRKYERIISNT